MIFTNVFSEIKQTVMDLSLDETHRHSDKSQADNPCKRERPAEDENGHHIPFSEFWCK